MNLDLNFFFTFLNLPCSCMLSVGEADLRQSHQMSNGGGGGGGGVEEEEQQEELNGGLAPERVALNLSLHIAAADGNVDECEKLLKEEGADAWWEDESTLNWSALHFAANGGHTKLVQSLLRQGALWNAGERRQKKHLLCGIDLD